MNYPHPFPPPSLEPGDRLTRDEFERRYEMMPDHKKAELLDGVVHLSTSISLTDHAGPHADFIGLLGFYRTFTPGVRASVNTTFRLDLDSEPAPDAVLIIEPNYGGQVKLEEDGYVRGAPELAGEISASTVSIDYDKKLPIYRRNNVKEYVVWRVQENEIDWFVLRSTEYEKLTVDEKGRYKSEVFPGLWLDPAAMVALDMPKVLAVLQEGLASPEHEEFVAKLHSAAKPQI